MTAKTLCPHNVPILIPGSRCAICNADRLRDEAKQRLAIVSGWKSLPAWTHNATADQIYMAEKMLARG